MGVEIAVQTAMMLAAADMEGIGTEKGAPKILGALGEATFPADQQEAQGRWGLAEMPPRETTRSPLGAEEDIMGAEEAPIMAGGAEEAPPTQGE